MIEWGQKVVIWSLDRSENVVQLLGDFQSEIVQDPDKSWIISSRWLGSLKRIKIAPITNTVIKY